MGAPYPGRFEQAVMRLWRTGFNTAEISERMGASEPTVARVLAAALDRKHAERKAA